MSSIDPTAAGTPRVDAPSARHRREGVRGWAVFAAVVLLIIGGLDIVYGLAAVLNNHVVIVGGHGVMVADVTVWGWITLILGVVLVLAGLGLLAENAAARWAAIVLVGIGAILQLPWFSAAPLWTILVIGLSVVVVYQLTMYWED